MCVCCVCIFCVCFGFFFLVRAMIRVQVPGVAVGCAAARSTRSGGCCSEGTVLHACEPLGHGGWKVR